MYTLFIRSLETRENVGILVTASSPSSTDIQVFTWLVSMKDAQDLKIGQKVSIEVKF